MSHLTEIEYRHRLDAWNDIVFIVVAALLLAVAVAGLTSRAAGKPIVREWTVTVVEGPVEILK
jgi:hypothetical protein